MDILNLPAELRLHIYSYIVPHSPLTVDARTYCGLLCTCKAIRDDFEPELCKAIAKDVHAIAARIRDKGDDIIFTPPRTFNGWRNLTVSRPKKRDLFLDNDPFLDFQHFNFDSFTVSFHNDIKGYEFYRGIPNTNEEAACDLAVMVGAWYNVERYPAMKNWRLDWNSSKGHRPSYAMRPVCWDSWVASRRMADQSQRTMNRSQPEYLPRYGRGRTE